MQTQSHPTPAPGAPIAGSGLALIPCTPAVAEAMHRLQEAILHDAPYLPAGSIVIVPRRPFTEFRALEAQWGEVLTFGNRDDQLTCRHYNEASDYMSPLFWYLEQERRDTNGKRWTNWLGAHVVDDFGQLAPVPQ